MKKTLLLLYLIGDFAAGSVSAQTQTLAHGSTTAPINFNGAGCTYTWVNSQPSIGLPAGGAGNIAAFTAVNNTGTPVVATITATPYPTVFAYIPNSEDNTVSVVNTVTGTVVATIPVGTRPLAVSVSPDGSKVYIGNTTSNDVSVISTATNTVIATIPVGGPANSLVVNHAGTMVYVTTNDVVEGISTASNTIVETSGSAGDPIGIAIGPTDQNVYTANYASPGAVEQIDVVDNVATFRLPTGNGPSGVTVTPDGSRVYVCNYGSSNVAVVDVATVAVIATIPVGNNPQASAISPDGKTLYVTNTGGGTISIINTTTNTVTATIPCGVSPFGINVSADGKTLYVTLVESNSLIAISTASNTILSTTPIGRVPLAIGDFLTPPATCSSAAQTITITVDPTPNVTATTATGYISACAGSASSSPAVQQFKVNATTATGPVTATAPSGFELSLSLNNGYGNSVTLAPAAGAINNVPVYVRSAATAPPGNISGNVTLTEGGATEQTIAVTGLIKALATVDQVADQVVLNGAPTTAVNFTGSGDTYTWSNNTPGIGLTADSTGNIPSFTAINTGSTPIVATISVTTKNAGYAYIGETLTSAVTVINTSTHKVLDSIAVGSGPYGMWQTPDGGYLYVCNSLSNSISVINTATQTVIATIPAGVGPTGIVGAADGKTAYVANADGTLTVINTATQTATATFPVGDNSFDLCLSPDGTTLYVTNPIYSYISVVSTATNTVTSLITVGSEPLAICISPDGTKLYEINYFDNNVYVISTATNSVINKIPVGQGPHNLTISADGSTLYTANQVDNTISVVNLASGQVTATIPVGTVPDGTALSPDGTTLWVTNLNSANVIAINTAADTVTNIVPVGSFPGSLGNFVGSDGCPSKPMTFTIKIIPTAPLIVVTGTLAPMTTVYGTPSTSDTFTVSGSNLTAGIVITPPPGFEVSTDGATFSSTVSIGDASTVSSTSIYIRLAATTPVSSYLGIITITSAGASAQDLTIPASTVTPAPLTITADDTTRPFGQANPVFTFTYNGFQNNETEASLVAAPQGTTTATESSPAGDYPIIPAGAEDSNYSFTYQPGTLKITAVSTVVSVPNAFTPNGDGKNDTWGIRNLANYTNCKVTVFNRYGQAVFTSTGYGTPWNGRQNGTDVPAGTYVYSIDLGNGTKPLTGTVIVIR